MRCLPCCFIRLAMGVGRYVPKVFPWPPPFAGESLVGRLRWLQGAMLDVYERVVAQCATLARARAERKNAAARAKYRARVTESCGYGCGCGGEGCGGGGGCSGGGSGGGGSGGMNRTQTRT